MGESSESVFYVHVVVATASIIVLDFKQYFDSLQTSLVVFPFIRLLPEVFSKLGNSNC